MHQSLADRSVRMYEALNTVGVTGEKINFHNLPKFGIIDVDDVMSTTGEMSKIWKEAIANPSGRADRL
jgi:methyltransferase-like protein